MAGEAAWGVALRLGQQPSSGCYKRQTILVSSRRELIGTISQLVQNASPDCDMDERRARYRKSLKVWTSALARINPGLLAKSPIALFQRCGVDDRQGCEILHRIWRAPSCARACSPARINRFSCKTKSLLPYLRHGSCEATSHAFAVDDM